MLLSLGAQGPGPCSAVLPVPPPPLLSHFCWEFWQGPLRASGREGQQGIHPLCVLAEITLSLASLKQGLVSWDLWGLTQCQLWRWEGMAKGVCRDWRGAACARHLEEGGRIGFIVLSPSFASLPHFQSGAARPLPPACVKDTQQPYFRRPGHV